MTYEAETEETKPVWELADYRRLRPAAEYALTTLRELRDRLELNNYGDEETFYIQLCEDTILFLEGALS